MKARLLTPLVDLLLDCFSLLIGPDKSPGIAVSTIPELAAAFVHEDTITTGACVPADDCGKLPHPICVVVEQSIHISGSREKLFATKYRSVVGSQHLSFTRADQDECHTKHVSSPEEYVATASLMRNKIESRSSKTLQD